ncbi:MAG: ATP-binding cassette domain-containing protein [Desulfovibrio sp.]
MSETLFEIKDLTYGYPGRTKVFKNVSARVDAGEFLVLEGPSGAGKSTLLRLLCRLEEPDFGTIFLHGEPLSSLDPVRLRRRVCYIQQTPTVVEGSVRANLLLPFSFKVNHDLPRPPDSDLRARLAEFLLDEVDLEQPASALSVGQKQRLCLIRALLLSPEAMLFDEPTSALDKQSAAVVMDAAHRLHAQGVAVILVTHSIGHEDIPGATALHVGKQGLTR